MFILGWIIFGALTGWVASKIVNKRGEGCMVNTALGLVGAVVGGFIFRELGVRYVFQGFFVSMFVAVIGAVIVLFVYHAVTGSRTLR
ncbi:MAG TPA: GlsB/YeaQ/YmgE family stress response membrane protein [Rhizomicrobium sp.]|jgi:uncharacterized membrane protein YeaQ/YmgE (transglycosylase-associated protein family)|nr:GlsB/YeaQ/YmgE family stress response membrane protein [Rhizomicrobium sp.]